MNHEFDNASAYETYTNDSQMRRLRIDSWTVEHYSWNIVDH